MWFLNEDQLEDVVTQLRTSSPEPSTGIEQFIENLKADEFPSQETIAALPAEAFAIFEEVVRFWFGGDGITYDAEAHRELEDLIDAADDALFTELERKFPERV